MRNRALVVAALLATCAVGPIPAHAKPTRPGWVGPPNHSIGNGPTGEPTNQPNWAPPQPGWKYTQAPPTATPIKHLVVIFQENVSFDHYFGTYPNATNPPGEPAFTPTPDTPSVNGLSEDLLTMNPNSANPFRLDRSQELICDQDHDYTPEQQAFDGGLMDMFPQFTGGCPEKNLTMGYYDGNTVTGLWNYAQNFAMSDNSYDTTFGPSTPGALNLVSGQTHGAIPASLPEVTENGTDYGDADPTYDDCSKGATIAMASTDKNVGEMLNEKGVTWGWFQGGFAPTETVGGKAVCGSSHKNVGGETVPDYSAHHEPFQYYAATANPHHLPPSSLDMIGKQDQANHQVRPVGLLRRAAAGRVASRVLLEGRQVQDGHAGYSDARGRAELPHARHQRIAALARLVEHSGRDRLRRLGRLLRPRDAPDRELVGFGTRCAQRAGQVRQWHTRQAATRIVVATAHVCRCLWSHRGRSTTSSITRSPTSLRSCASLRTTGGLGRIGDGSFDARSGSLQNMFGFGPHHGMDGRLFLNESTGEPLYPTPPWEGDTYGH